MLHVNHKFIKMVGVWYAMGNIEELQEIEKRLKARGRHEEAAIARKAIEAIRS